MPLRLEAAILSRMRSPGTSRSNWALHDREQLQQSNPQALFAAGDKVVITDGPFAGIEAIYQTADAEQRSMILLSMLNKPVAMRIEPGKLRKCG